MKGRNGFTLIELLVVIAIIAILAAILFPVFAQAREKARGITCVSNEKQLALGVLMYIQDYDETFPQHWYCTGPGGNQACAGTGTLDAPFTATAPESIMGWNDAMWISCTATVGTTAAVPMRPTSAPASPRCPAITAARTTPSRMVTSSSSRAARWVWSPTRLPMTRSRRRQRSSPTRRASTP